MDVESQVREFVTENFLYGRSDVDPGKIASFIEMGIIDSTGVLEIVNFLESRFGVTVADDELVPENLDSVAKIVGYLKRKAETGNGSGHCAGRA